jgi:hypothetical protein
MILTSGIHGEALHNLEEDDDMLAAIARELVEQDGIGQLRYPNTE